MSFFPYWDSETLPSQGQPQELILCCVVSQPGTTAIPLSVDICIISRYRLSWTVKLGTFLYMPFGERHEYMGLPVAYIRKDGMVGS